MPSKGRDDHDGSSTLNAWPSSDLTGTCSPRIPCHRQLSFKVDDVNALPFQDDAPLQQRVAPSLVVFQSKERLQEISSSPEQRYTRRLSDQITASFYEACRIGNLDAAAHLAAALECEVVRSVRVAGVEDRYDGNDIAAVQARYELEVRKRQQEADRQEPSATG